MSKITYNYSPQSTGDLAVMPNSLAQRLLKNYANRLNSIPTDRIHQEFLAKLNPLINGKHEDFNKVVEDYLLERQLIENISNENWDVYKINNEVTVE